MRSSAVAPEGYVEPSLRAVIGAGECGVEDGLHVGAGHCVSAEFCPPGYSAGRYAEVLGEFAARSSGPRTGARWLRGRSIAGSRRDRRRLRGAVCGTDCTSQGAAGSSTRAYIRSTRLARSCAVASGAHRRRKGAHREQLALRRRGLCRRRRSSCADLPYSRAVLTVSSITFR